MTHSEYTAYYMNFVVTTIVPSVNREMNNDKANNDEEQKKEIRKDLENKKNGLVLLALISFIESNFLSKTDLRLLRQFQAPSVSLPPTLNQVHLSCFIYLRDCFAHNPAGELLSPGQNTGGFTAAVESGAFPWATISGQSITVVPTGIHKLHLNVLRFFGETIDDASDESLPAPALGLPPRGGG